MNKKSLVSLALGLTMAAAMPFTASGADKLLAFPGAEGFGRYATGGRGGEIYHVTNLNDSGTGSLRDAVSKSGRIIVFDVSGVIRLQSGLVFSGNSTILGQTAPGEGVQVYGDRVSFSGASNLIVRHMRFRMGVNGTSGKDAAGVANGGNMIFDHLSVLWGQDECFSINGDNKGTEPHDITIQNSIIGQGLQTHSCGGLMQTNGGVTLYRNLYIENKTRNPKVKGVNQFVNNVLYNWGSGAAYNMGGDSEGTSWTEITDNYFVRGPWKGATRPLIGGNNDFHYYGDGNYYDSNINGAFDGEAFSAELYSLSGGNKAASMAEVNSGMSSQKSVTTATGFPAIEGRMTAPEAVEWMLAHGGASLPVRDEVDQYLIDELASFGTIGTTNGISTEKILPHGGTGTLFGGTKPLDTDGDGIPDEWENANGLNPNDATDAAKIASNGYANIENYVFTLDGPYPYLKNPTGLKSKEIEKDAITISWRDNSDYETGFVVEISSDGKTFTKAGETGAGVNEFKASGLKENTVYYFRVYAVGDGIESPISPVLKSLTIDEPYKPSACKIVSPVNGNTMRVLDSNLKWSNSTEDYFGEIKYDVYIGTSPESLSLLMSDINETSIYPGELTPGTKYYWRVDARNDIGTTEGAVWSFTLRDGGTMFYINFKDTPTEFANSDCGANAAVGGGMDLFGDTGKHNGEFEFGQFVIGCTAGRIHLFGDRANDAYSADDAGATKSALGFVGKSSTMSTCYAKINDIDGPWTITIYTYNSDGASLTYDLSYSYDSDGDDVEDTKEKLATYSIAASKKVFKRTYTFAKNTGKGTIIIDNISGGGIEFNDILVERFVADEVEPLEMTGARANEISYADGTFNIAFNQNIMYNGGVTVTGGDQWEDFKVSASGKNLTVAYNALNVNTDYTVHIPYGAVTTVDGSTSCEGDVTLTTCASPPVKASGETHYGHATTLPLDFKPFNSYSHFSREDGTSQSKAGDHPHWVTASGTTTASYAQMTKTSDKLMTYFNSEPEQLYVELSASSTCTVKIQETRNADIAPAWRTIRVLTQADMPFKGYIDLNPETRFIKIVPTAVSGNVQVNEFQVLDAMSGIRDVIGDVDTTDTEYYNLQGIRIENPGPGLYIRRTANGVDKVLIK